MRISTLGCLLPSYAVMMRQTDSQGSSADEQNEIDPKQYEGGTSADGVQTSSLGASGQQEAEMEPSASHGQSSTADGKQLSPIAPFVSKTYGIVNDEPDDVVSWWTSHGEDTFVIKSVDVFQEQVLPRFFSHRNYSSFVRQLNNHGFSRVRSPSSAGDGRGGRPEHEAQWWEFKHPRFRRGQKSLLSEIKRRKEKKRPPLGAHSRVFLHQSALAQSGDQVGGGQGEHAVRWEMENMQEQMRDVSRKLDELKSLVVGLVVCVRESGIPTSVQQSSTRRSVTEGTWGARSEGVYGYAPGSGQSPHHHSGEQQPLQEPPQQQQLHHQQLQQRQPHHQQQQQPHHQQQQQQPHHQASQQQQPQQQQPQQQQPQQQQPQQQPHQQQPPQQQLPQQQPPQQQQPHHQQPHHQHQLQHQQQYPLSPYPPPSMPPNLAPQHLEQGQQQLKQQSEPQKHSQQHPSTGWGVNGCRSDGGASSSAGGDSCPSMQQVPSGKPPLSEPSRLDKSAAQEGTSQAEDSPRQSSPSAGRMKRPREDTTPYHNPNPHPQHIDAPPPPAPAFASAVGPGALPGPHVEGPTDPSKSAQAVGPGAVNVNAGPSCLGAPSNVYQDVHMRFAPDGVAGGGAGGGGQHMGGMTHWQKPWPGGTVDNIYQYHVPIRVAGYPIPMQSVPMQYTVPPTGPPPFVPMGGGGAPSGVSPFSSQSSFLPLPEQLTAQPQPHAAVPMQAAEGSIAMTLSTMKGGSTQQAPIDGGNHHPHPHHQQQREYENRETRFGTGPSQSSGHPMTSAPSS